MSDSSVAPATRVAVIHTVEDLNIIRAQGYSGYPRAALWRPSGYSIVVFTQNARKVGVWDFCTPTPCAHRAAFGLGRVRSVESDDGGSHLTVYLNEVAALDPPIPDVWPASPLGTAQR